jgi:hypothetical protein
MVVRDPGRPRRVGKTIKQVGAPQARSRSGRFRASCGDRSPHMTIISSCHAPAAADSPSHQGFGSSTGSNSHAE